MKKRFRFIHLNLLTTLLTFSACWSMEDQVSKANSPMDCGQESSHYGSKRQREANYPNEKRGEGDNPRPFKQRRMENSFAEDECNIYLPDEVWLYVLSFLSAQDLCSVSQVCHSLHTVSEDASLWRELGQRDQIGDVQDKLEYAVRRYPGIPSKHFLNLAKRFPATPFAKISMHFLADMGDNGEINKLRQGIVKLESEQIASCTLTVQNGQEETKGSVLFPLSMDNPMFFLVAKDRPLFVKISYENLPLNLTYKFNSKPNIYLENPTLTFPFWQSEKGYDFLMLHNLLIKPNTTCPVNPITEESLFNNSPMAKNLYLSFGRESKSEPDHKIIFKEYRRDLFAYLGISSRLAHAGLFYYGPGNEQRWKMVREDLLVQLMKADYLCYYCPGDEESWNIASKIHSHIFPALYKDIPFSSRHALKEEFTEKYKPTCVALEARIVKSVIPYLKNKKYLSALGILAPYFNVAKDGAYSARLFAQAAYARYEEDSIQGKKMSKIGSFNPVLHHLALAWEINPQIFTTEKVPSPELDKNFSANLVVSYLNKFFNSELPFNTVDTRMIFIIGYHSGVRDEKFQKLGNSFNGFNPSLGSLWEYSYYNGAYSDTSLLLKQADNLRQLGQYNKSLTVIKGYLRYDREIRRDDCPALLNIKTSFYSQSYLLAADILMELGQYKDASSYYEKHINRHSLPVNQDSLPLYGKWGEAALRAQNWSQAARIFEGIISFLKVHNLSLSEEMYSQAYEAFFNEGWKK